MEITADITQNIPPLKCNEWDIYIYNLPKGTYKFIYEKSSDMNRLDSEWFIENTRFYLIKSNNKYYNINNKQYDEINKSYNSLTMTTDWLLNFNNNTFDFYSLNSNVTINQETFKPLEKFDNFTINKLEW